MNRQILTVRDRGIEALLRGLPLDDADKVRVRPFAERLKNDLAKWDMARRGLNGGRHG